MTSIAIALVRLSDPTDGGAKESHRIGRPFQFGFHEQGMQLDPGCMQRLPAARFAVDHTEGMLDDAAQRTQLLARCKDLPARRDNIFDDEEASMGHLAPLGEPARAIVLRALPHEERRQPGPERERRNQGDPAELEAREGVYSGGH